MPGYQRHNGIWDLATREPAAIGALLRRLSRDWTLHLSHHVTDGNGDIATVLVDEYRCRALKPLRCVRTQVADVVRAFAHLGFQHRVDLSGGGNCEDIRTSLKEWRPSTRRLVFYWTGHGRCEGEHLYLLAADTDKGEVLTDLNAVPAQTLGQALARTDAEAILLLVDSCYSGGGATEIAAAFAATAFHKAIPGGGPRGIAVIMSARQKQTALETVFSSALLKVISEGPPGGPEDGLWGRHDACFTPAELAKALWIEMDRCGRSKAFVQHPDFAAQGITAGFLRNPSHDPNLPSRRLGVGTRPPLPGKPRLQRVLGALAWAEGSGLPRRDVWLAVANALERPDDAYTDADLAELFAVARSHLVEAGEDGQTVYRLYDRGLVGRMRSEWERSGRSEEAHSRVVTALLGTASYGGLRYWPAANPYALRHLATHAAACGRMDELVTDPLYLVTAVPDVLGRALGAVRSSRAQAAVSVYLSAAPYLVAGAYADNAALLELSACLRGVVDLVGQFSRLEFAPQAGQSGSCARTGRQLPALVLSETPGENPVIPVVAGHPVASCDRCTAVLQLLRSLAQARVRAVEAAWHPVTAVRGSVFELRERLHTLLTGTRVGFGELPITSSLQPLPRPVMLHLRGDEAEDGTIASTPAVGITLPDQVARVELSPVVDRTGRASLDIRVDSTTSGSVTFAVLDDAGGLLAKYPPQPVPAGTHLTIPTSHGRDGSTGLTVEVEYRRDDGTKTTTARLHFDADRGTR